MVYICMHPKSWTFAFGWILKYFFVCMLLLALADDLSVRFKIGHHTVSLHPILVELPCWRRLNRYIRSPRSCIVLFLMVNKNQQGPNYGIVCDVAVVPYAALIMYEHQDNYLDKKVLVLAQHNVWICRIHRMIEVDRTATLSCCLVSSFSYLCVR